MTMQLPPASVIASWPAPNHVNPPTTGLTNTIVSSALLGLVTIVVALRLYTRHWISNGLGLDDLFIILAYVSGDLLFGIRRRLQLTRF